MSVFFGIFAALSWGVHDLLVRQVTQRMGTSTALSSVLALSMLLLFLALLITPEADFTITSQGLGLSVLSGLTFAVASFSLYRAFEIGPVRLVAPIIGAYPVISVAWASIFSAPIPLSGWLAVGAVVTGVGLVVALSEKPQGAARANTGRAVLWDGDDNSGMGIFKRNDASGPMGRCRHGVCVYCVFRSVIGGVQSVKRTLPIKPRLRLRWA